MKISDLNPKLRAEALRQMAKNGPRANAEAARSDLSVKPISAHRLDLKTQGSAFSEICASMCVPPPVPEFRFHQFRKWRFDYAWPDHKVALEVQGGIFSQGRHTRGAALLKEWEKLNEAAILGWRILYCQPKDLCTTVTVSEISQAISFANTKPTFGESSSRKISASGSVPDSGKT